MLHKGLWQAVCLTDRRTRVLVLTTRHTSHHPCTQVLNKQVITRTSGRCLGTISGAWMDPGSGALVSFDLDERRQGSGGGGLGLSSPARAGNIPLTALRQVGALVELRPTGLALWPSG
jgi:hypothetical protein